MFILQLGFAYVSGVIPGLSCKYNTYLISGIRPGLFEYFGVLEIFYTFALEMVLGPGG